MNDTNVRSRPRHRITGSAVALVVTGAAIASSASSTALALAGTGTTAAAPVRPNEVVDSLEGTFGAHPGQRRNHIKGTCAVGEFVGTSAASILSRSGLSTGFRRDPKRSRNGAGIPPGGWKQAASRGGLREDQLRSASDGGRNCAYGRPRAVVPIACVRNILR